MTQPPTTHSHSVSRPQAGDLYRRLVSLLDGAGAHYRLIEHPPEGRTEVVSAYRGHPVACAAKCLIVMVKLSKRTSRYFLAVVPGDARVDLQALKLLAGGTYAAFASPDKAEALAGSVSGTILPFSSHPDLELVADPGLLAHPQIYFNAARLDRSVALRTKDYLRIANPRIHPITSGGDRPNAERPPGTDSRRDAMGDTPAYVVNDQPLVAALQRLDVQQLIDDATDAWYNQTLCRVGDVVVRLGVMQGEYHWHKHDEQDEFFFVLDGVIRIELEGLDTVELGPRQAFIVPKRLPHRPVVAQRSAALMIERGDVVATGD